MNNLVLCSGSLVWSRPFMDSFLLESYLSSDVLLDIGEYCEEKNDKYVYSIELPSHNKKDITVTVSDSYVEVLAEKKNRKGTLWGKSRNVVSEKLYKSFYISDDVNIDAIRAKYRSGKLIIEMPKVKKSAYRIRVDGDTDLPRFNLLKAGNFHFWDRIKKSIGNLFRKR